jgi:hypothetical protein
VNKAGSPNEYFNNSFTIKSANGDLTGYNFTASLLTATKDRKVVVVTKHFTGLGGASEDTVKGYAFDGETAKEVDIGLNLKVVDFVGGDLGGAADKAFQKVLEASGKCLVAVEYVVYRNGTDAEAWLTFDSVPSRNSETPACEGLARFPFKYGKFQLKWSPAQASFTVSKKMPNKS